VKYPARDITDALGFTRKPPLIVVFSIFYFLNPFGNFLFIWMTAQKTAREILLYLYFSSFVKPDPFIIGTLLLWASSLILAVGLYRVRLWAWYGFIAHSLLTFLSSIYQLSSGQFGISRAFWINILVLVPLGFFIRREIRKPYFNPLLRWWEQHSRLQESVKARLTWNEYTFDEKTFDLSPDGIFVQTDDLEDVAVGYFFNVRLYFSEDRKLDIQGVVVWINFEPGRVPRGYGIKFLGISKNNRLFISKYIKDKLKTFASLLSR